MSIPKTRYVRVEKLVSQIIVMKVPADMSDDDISLEAMEFDHNENPLQWTARVHICDATMEQLELALRCESYLDATMEQLDRPCGQL